MGSYRRTSENEFVFSSSPSNELAPPKSTSSSSSAPDLTSPKDIPRKQRSTSPRLVIPVSSPALNPEEERRGSHSSIEYPRSPKHRSRHSHDDDKIASAIQAAMEKARNIDLDSEPDDALRIPSEATKNHGKMDSELVRHLGGCHCGAVRYQVYDSPTPKVIDCNCSICVKKQCRHFIVPQSKFKLLKGHDSLKTYTFNTHKAKHIFCSVCGVQSFYIPRSNSDGYGIMPHCLDPGTVRKERLEKFDGRNWDQEIKKKGHILDYSKETS